MSVPREFLTSSSTGWSDAVLVSVPREFLTSSSTGWSDAVLVSVPREFLTSPCLLNDLYHCAECIYCLFSVYMPIV